MKVIKWLHVLSDNIESVDLWKELITSSQKKRTPEKKTFLGKWTVYFQKKITLIFIQKYGVRVPKRIWKQIHNMMNFYPKNCIVDGVYKTLQNMCLHMVSVFAKEIIFGERSPLWNVHTT